MNIEESIDYLTKSIDRQEERVNKFREIMRRDIDNASAKDLIRWAEEMHTQEINLRDMKSQLIVYKKMRISQK